MQWGSPITSNWARIPDGSAATPGHLTHSPLASTKIHTRSFPLSPAFPAFNKAAFINTHGITYPYHLPSCNQPNTLHPLPIKTTVISRWEPSGHPWAERRVLIGKEKRGALQGARNVLDLILITGESICKNSLICKLKLVHFCVSI